MKRTIKIYSIVAIAVLLISGCSKDWLDINKDPNKTETASAELVHLCWS